MNKTIGLFINGKKIFADEGTTILEAARQNDISIPTLCYHPRVEPLGHCRMCVVHVEGLERPVTSCDNPVTEGMSVTTDSAALKAMRSSIVELALATHPYKDCLTCVRTGTCELQDNAYCFQANLPEQLEREIPAKNADQNDYIVRDEEKCILCGRCVQVCRSGPGCFVYSFIGKGVNTRVVPARNGKEVTLEEAGCIYCGQCVDVCPVAALTEKGRSSGGREWDLTAVPGICVECSLGCYLERNISDDAIVKVTVPREGDKVGWLCAKGKYGYLPENSGRLSKDSDHLAVAGALKETAERLLAIKAEHGADSLAVLANGQLSIEENYLLQKLARQVLETPNLDLGAEEAWVKAASKLQDYIGCAECGPTPAALSRAEAVLVIGDNLEESHPVTAMAIGQAGRFGDAEIIRTAEVNGDSTAWQQTVFNLKKGEDKQFIEALLNVVKGTANHKNAGNSSFDQQALEKAAALICGAKSYIVVCPSYFADADQEAIDLLMKLAIASKTVEQGRSRLLLLSAYSNAGGVLTAGGTPWFGPGPCPLSGSNGLNRKSAAAAVSNGTIKGVLSFGPFPEEMALQKCEFTVLVDSSENARSTGADIMLPAQAIESKEGYFTNASGATNYNRAALKPGGQNGEDWRLICDLANLMGAKWNYASLDAVREEMEA